MKLLSKDELKTKMLKSARYYARLFTDLMGIDSLVVERAEIDASTECPKACSFCRWAEQVAHPSINCQRTATHAGMCALKADGKYPFFCESGFIHFAVPIQCDGEHIATFVGGPIQICDHKELLVDTVMQKMKIDPLYRGEAVKRIVDIPNLVPAKVSKAMEVMHALVSHVVRIADSTMNINSLAGFSSFWSYQSAENELIARLNANKKDETTRMLVRAASMLDTFLKENLEHGRNMTLRYFITLSRLYVDRHRGNLLDVEENFGVDYIRPLQLATTAGAVNSLIADFNQAFLERVFVKEHTVHNTVISRVIEYVNHNYMNKITLESTAEFAYLSSSYLSKIFKEEVGCNFNTFLNKLRIEKAKKLLTDDNINIMEVANLVGYEDQSYFSKVFRRITGTTPKKYKDSKIYK